MVKSSQNIEAPKTSIHAEPVHLHCTHIPSPAQLVVVMAPVPVEYQITTRMQSYLFLFSVCHTIRYVITIKIGKLQCREITWPFSPRDLKNNPSPALPDREFLKSHAM